VFAKPRNKEKKIKRYNEESNAYTNVNNSSDKYIQTRPRTCWVCGGRDKRTNSAHKVLC